MKRMLWISFIGSILISKVFLFNPATQLLGDFGDKYEFFMFQYLVKQNILNFHYPLEKSYAMRYPVGFELGHGYDGAFSTFVGAFLGMTMPQTLAYNVTLILILWVNFICTYILMKKLSRNILIQYIGSIMYAWSPYVIARINGHPNLAFIGGFPLFVYMCLTLYEKLRIIQTDPLHRYYQKFLTIDDITRLGLTLLLIAAGSVQYLIILVESSLLMTILAAILFPKNIVSTLHVGFRYLKECIVSLGYKKILIPIGLCSAIFLFFYGPFVLGMISGSFVYTFDFANYRTCCVPRLSDIFIPNTYLHPICGKINNSNLSIEKVITLGIVEWIVLFWMIVKEKRKRSTKFLVGLLGLFIILSLDLLHMPYWPEGGRFIVIFSLFWILFFSSFAESLSRRVLILIAIALIIERIPLQFHSTPPLPIAETKIVRELPGTAVLDIPLSKYNALHSINAYLYGKSIIDGYFNDTAETHEASSFLRDEFIQRYICDSEKGIPDKLAYYPTNFDDSLRLFHSIDLHTVVIHKDPQYEKFLYNGCTNVRYWWYNLAPEQIVLKDSILDVASQTIELVKNPAPKIKFYFSHAGKLYLNGLFIVPTALQDTHITLPDGSTITPQWNYVANGLKSVLDMPIEIEGYPGQSIEISSNINTGITDYITVYYSFQSENTSEVAIPPIEKVYSSKNMDIYEIH